jgi:predicted esterase
VARALTIETITHGRVLVEDAADSSLRRGTLVVFHGYGQSAEDMLGEVCRIAGASAWTIVAVQALHRFYTRDNQRVIASWMTRQDRELAIADNVEYVDRALAEVGIEAPVVFFGFSQGVAMAFRAALVGRQEAAGIVALAGDIPPELKEPGVTARRWPPVFIATGSRDTWFTPARLAGEVSFLESRQVPHEALVFEGGHEWTDTFREAAGAWLERLAECV